MSTLLSFTALAAATRQHKPHLPSKAALKRTALGLALVAALGFAGDRGYDYWKVGRFQVSTDNAYVQADYTTVAPKISGYITEVLVGDNETVKAGQVLARIDDRDFQVALDQARPTSRPPTPPSATSMRRSPSSSRRSTRTRPRSPPTEAALTFAAADNTRYDNLMKTGYGTVQRAQLAETTLREKTAALREVARRPAWSPSARSTC